MNSSLPFRLKALIFAPLEQYSFLIGFKFTFQFNLLKEWLVWALSHQASEHWAALFFKPWVTGYLAIKEDQIIVVVLD